MECGICFRDSCSHHNYFPAHYFLTHPEAREAAPPEDWEPQPDLPVTYISEGFSNLAKPPYTAELLRWLEKRFSAEEIQRSVELYHVGQRMNGQIEWPQFDMEGNLHEIKLQGHSADSGHRTNKIFGYWVGTYTMHAELVKCGILEESRSEQCFFGEHLLVRFPDKPICVVESERTAFYFSLVLPEFVWVATGGSNFISKIWAIKQHLRGRTVIVYPDAGEYDEWSAKLAKWGINCMVSDICESFSHNTDILDLIEKEEQHSPEKDDDVSDNLQDVIDIAETDDKPCEAVQSLADNLPLARQMLNSDDMWQRLKAQLFWATYEPIQKEQEQQTPPPQTEGDTAIVALNPQQRLEALRASNPAIDLLADKLDLIAVDDDFEPF
jgi:hypothetical protein